MPSQLQISVSPEQPTSKRGGNAEPQLTLKMCISDLEPFSIGRAWVHQPPGTVRSALAPVRLNRERSPLLLSQPLGAVVPLVIISSHQLPSTSQTMVTLFPAHTRGHRALRSPQDQRPETIRDQGSASRPPGAQADHGHFTSELAPRGRVHSSRPGGTNQPSVTGSRRFSRAAELGSESPASHPGPRG